MGDVGDNGRDDEIGFRANTTPKRVLFKKRARTSRREDVLPCDRPISRATPQGWSRTVTRNPAPMDRTLRDDK